MPAPHGFLQDLLPLQRELETRGFRFELGFSPKSPLDVVAHFEKPQLFVWIVQEGEQFVAYADRKREPTVTIGRFQNIIDAQAPVVGWVASSGDV